jgi:hypothetical protein
MPPSEKSIGQPGRIRYTIIPRAIIEFSVPEAQSNFLSFHSLTRRNHEQTEASQGILNCNRRIAGSVAQHFYLISR